MTIKETPSYKLVIGKSVESGNPCYQVVNKEYGVIEIETYMLPQALRYVEDLQAGLDAVLHPDFFSDKPKQPKIVPLSKKDL